MVGEEGQPDTVVSPSDPQAFRAPSTDHGGGSQNISQPVQSSGVWQNLPPQDEVRLNLKPPPDDNRHFLQKFGDYLHGNPPPENPKPTSAIHRGPTPTAVRPQIPAKLNFNKPGSNPPIPDTSQVGIYHRPNGR